VNLKSQPASQLQWFNGLLSDLLADTPVLAPWESQVDMDPIETPLDMIFKDPLKPLLNCKDPIGNLTEAPVALGWQLARHAGGRGPEHEFVAAECSAPTALTDTHPAAARYTAPPPHTHVDASTPTAPHCL
jgi:hypothetical protein